MIKELFVKKLDAIWTSDGKKLGLAQRLFYRTEGVEPKQLLFEVYLEIENFELGSNYFVPTDFIVEKEDGVGDPVVSKSFQEIQELTWFRMPAFVAAGEGREEALPEQ
jgi:hypothetical protein